VLFDYIFLPLKRNQNVIWCDEGNEGLNPEGCLRDTRGTAVCCVWWSARHGTDYREARRTDTSDCGVDAMRDNCTSFRRGLMLRQITNCSNRDFLKGLFRVTNKRKRLVEKLDILLHSTWGGRSQWPRGLRRGSSAVRMLGLRV